MKKLMLALFLITLSITGFSQDFPAKPDKLVNDYTGTLSSAQVQQLEQKLVAFNDSTSTQIAIAVLKSVGDYDINEYTLELGRKWGVGSSGKNNGIMIVVALGDRKISIQTGYGLEGILPDIYAKRIIENEIKPYFKSGDYYQGLESGTNAIIKYTKGEYKSVNPKTKGGVGGSVIVIIIIIIVIIIILKRGGGSGGGRVIGSRGVADALFWSMLLGSGRSSGSSSWGGGGSSGGGFGGFGGGSFGGGGSSGSW